MKPLRLAFAGSPTFAGVQLARLCAEEAQVVGVFTPPDRPAGRGRQLQACAVKVLAEQYGLPAYQPTRWKTPEALALLESLQIDLLIVSAYGFILPQAVLEIPRYGCWNIHASLLPRWRGASPIQHGILQGDQQSGITLMQMSAGMDEGDILLQAPLAIASTDTTVTLTEKLAHLGADLLIQGLAQITQLQPQAQDASKATFCHKICKEDGKINWSLPASQLERMVRAFNPWPVAYFECDGQRIRVWEAQARDIHAAEPAGTVVAISKNGLQVVTGQGVLEIHRLQIPGKTAITVSSNSTQFTIGTHFE